MQANNASGYQAEVFSVVWDEVRLAVETIGAAAMDALAAGADASTSAAGALASTRMTWRLSSYCLTKSTATSARSDGASDARHMSPRPDNAAETAKTMLIDPAKADRT